MKVIWLGNAPCGERASEMHKTGCLGMGLRCCNNCEIPEDSEVSASTPADRENGDA